jgi:hypothetical protein
LRPAAVIETVRQATPAGATHGAATTPAVVQVRAPDAGRQLVATRDGVAILDKYKVTGHKASDRSNELDR